MPLLANIRPRIIEGKAIHVRRTLPTKGEIFVTKDSEVAPHDIIGKSVVSAGFSAVNIARKLGVNPQAAANFLQKPVGKTIFKGELLAFKKGTFFKKVITAPTDGIIDNYDEQSGELRLKFLPREVPLTAGVYGIVDDINKIKGEITIKTVATLAYGVFGFGRERNGILHILSDRNNLVRPQQLTPHMSQNIVVSGALIYAEALRKAATFGIKAVISGGLNLMDFKGMVGSLNSLDRAETDVGITVFAAEGFGPIPIGKDIFNLLKQYDGRFVFVDGNKARLLLPSGNSDSLIFLRKVSLPVNQLTEILPEIIASEIKVGNKVRITWPPLMGAQGKVVAIDGSVTVLESGMSTYLITVETEKQKIKVPFPNLELL